MVVESQRMQALPSQFFAALTTRAAARAQAGFDVINLGQGNPDLPTPPHIVAALQAAAADPMTHRYPPFRGLPALKEAAAVFYEREYGVTIDPAREVAILLGGKSGLVEVSQIYLDPGDVALVPDPGYPDYWSGIALAGGRMVTMPLVVENAFLPDFSLISQADLAKAKLMFLNYPNNPTGAIAHSALYDATVALAKQHNFLVVHDFAYAAIGFEGHRPPSFLQSPGAKEVGIEIYTLSKSYNMAGWRVAFAVGNADVIEQINILQDHYHCSLFPGIQLAAATALTGDQGCVVNLKNTYESRRNIFLRALRDAGLQCPPSGGSFFVWVPVPQGFTALSYADALFEEENVVVAPGVGFGTHGEGYVRIGLLTSEERLVEAAERMGRVAR